MRLVLAPESPLLEMLLHKGWGKSWGTFLSSHAAIHELQWFLRGLLTAMLPDGTAVLLRYYDPRVLRTLIASSTAHQLHILFGRVLHYLIEAEEPEFALAFSISPKGLRTIRMPLCKQGEAKVELTQPLPETQSGSAVDYVYRLRHEQMDRLEANKTDGMAGALLEDIRKFYPDDFAANGKVRIEALIRHACQRAPKYGIQAQADLLVYVVVMLHCGMYFDVDPIHPWSSRILTMRLKPGDKMERLKVAASKAHKHSANESTRLIPKLPGVQPIPAAERNDIR